MDVPKLLLEVGPPAGWGRTGARDLSIAERKALLAAWSSMSAEERNSLVRDFNAHHEKQAEDRRAGREAEHEHAQYPRNIGMGAVRGILGGTAGGAIAAPLMVDGRVTSAKALLHAAGKKAVIGASTGAVLGTIYEAGKAQGRAEEIKKSGVNKRLHPIDITVAKGTKAVLGPGMKDTVMRGAVAGLLGGAGYSGYHSPAAGGWKGRALLAAHGGGIGAMKGALTGVGVGAIRGLGDKAGKNEEVMDRLVQQSQKAHRKHGSALTPADIHALADRLGVKWDNAPAFMANCKKWVGKAHLDAMTSTELARVASCLQSTKCAASPEAMALFHRAQETQKKMLPVLHREREKLDRKFGETFEPFSSVHSGINLPDEGASDIDLNVGVHDVHAFSKRLDKAGIPYVKSRDNTRVHTYTTPEGYDVELKVRPKVEVDYQIPGRDRVNALSDHEKAEFIHEKWKAKNSGDPKQYADVKYKLYERYGMIPPGGDWNSLTKKAGVLAAFA